MEVNKVKTSSSSNDDGKRKISLQTVTLADTGTNKPPKPRPQMSLVSSMIEGLQREDTFTEETVTSVATGPEGKDSRVDKSRFKRQITSTSFSLSVVTPQTCSNKNDNRFKKMGIQAMQRNCDLLLSGEGGSGKNRFESHDVKANRIDNAASDYTDKGKGLRKTSNSDNLGKIDGDLMEPFKSSQLIESEPENIKETTCCFQWKPSFPSNKVQKGEKSREDPEKMDLEKNEAEMGNDEREKKGSLLQRLKAKLTWRNVLAVLCPCFTYYILEMKNVKKPSDKPENEKEGSEKEHCEVR